MGAFDALSERPFCTFYLARATSVFGDGLPPVALAFGVLQVKDSATALGSVLAFRFVSLGAFCAPSIESVEAETPCNS
ncbi:MAG: hypothetical protein ACRD0Z_03475 [Acidimicrobiales bacterium]